MTTTQRQGSLDRGMTGRVAAYAAELDEAALPAEVVDKAKAVLADTLGCMMAGSRQRNVGAVLDALTSARGGPCTVAGRGGGVEPAVAALANGVAIHLTDLDDSHAPSRTHPAAVVIPAALAAAEAAERCSGRALLAGIVVGYDVTARMGKAMGVRSPFARGFQSAPVSGAVGAAVGAGRILGLGVRQLESSIALAASQSCGLTTYEDDPTHTINSFQMGLGARNGVTAALLARAGLAPDTDVLSGPKSMLSAFSPVADPEQLSDGLGERFEICDTSLKRHACCGQAHAAIDALLWLREHAGLDPDDIERIDVELTHDALAMLDGTPLWTHNIQYVLSVAALEGRVDVEHFTDRWLGDPSVAAMMGRIRPLGSDALQQRLPRQKGGVVTVTTRAGQVTKHMPAPLGNPEAPLSADDRHEKARRLAEQGGWEASRAERLIELVDRVDEAATPAPLLDLLASAG